MPAYTIEVLDRTALEVVETPTHIEVIQSSPQVVVLPATVEVVEVQVQGPQGPPGAPGSASATTLTAGEVLGGNRVVAAMSGGAFHASNETANHAKAALGLTTESALSGAPVGVQFSGVMDEPGWTWPADSPLFLGTNGMLTSVAPTTGFVRQVAWAVTATRILITPQPPIIL